jgi:hypothetical protein
VLIIMKTLRQFAHFTGAPPPIGLRAIGDRLHLNVWDQTHKARRMLEFFPLLASGPVDFGVHVTPVTSGVAPLAIQMRIGPPGPSVQYHFMSSRWRVLRGGQPVSGGVYEASVASHTLTEPGQYAAEATVRGIGKDGYAEVIKAVAISVTAPASPPPPTTPPPNRVEPDLAFTGAATWNNSTKKIEISFKNIGNANAGAFRVGAQVNNTSIGEVIYNEMAVGQGDTVSFSPGFLPPGDYTYNFVLDLYSAVDESNENNNGFNGTFAIPG